MADRLVLGLYAGHNRAASLVRNGELIGHIAQERLDRRKASPSNELPWMAANALLAQHGTTFDALAAVGITFALCEPTLFQERWRSEILDRFPKFSGDVLGIDHHLAHAWSVDALWRPGERKTIFVADGGGDLKPGGLQAESAYHLEQGRATMVFERLQTPPAATMSHPGSHGFDCLSSFDRDARISLGRKYTQLSYLVGFGPGQEGKAMGLAAWGEPLFEWHVKGLARGEFDLTFSDVLEELRAIWLEDGRPFGAFLRDKRSHIAATAQGVLEAHIEPILEGLAAENPKHGLAGAGGVFLNCLMNGKLRRRSWAREFFVPPPAGDDGQSIGAAVAASIALGSSPTTVPATLPYLGHRNTDREIDDAIGGAGLSAVVLSDERLAVVLADILMNEQIVGVVRGRTELGPRALGNRSILALPTRSESKQRLDHEIKHREV